jgi:hypothetical protein
MDEDRRAKVGLKTPLEELVTAQKAEHSEGTYRYTTMPANCDEKDHEGEDGLQRFASIDTHIHL